MQDNKIVAQGNDSKSRQNILRENLKRPQARAEIIQEFCRDKCVLDIGCVQHDVENSQVDAWLHEKVVAVAGSVLGVDYLKDAVTTLTERGYNIVWGDVNNQLNIEERFDTIVVGNLIEHLSNFEGLVNNINRLLNENGVVLISTANPFYCEQYFFSAFNNDIIVNPEHTCWLDPLTLDQLVRRFGLVTKEIRWVKEKWKLSSGVIYDGKGAYLNIFTGRWEFDSNPCLFEKIISKILFKIFSLFIDPFGKGSRTKKQYGDELGRFLYFRIKAYLFGLYWNARQLFVPMSDINKFELYVSVIGRKDSA
jgi:2-polyprenyl-3-methyl-5-hydroxy-6-metoxy-1,4-benzoquinol methylase